MYPIYTFEQTYSLNQRRISGAFAENLKYIVDHGNGYYTFNVRKAGLYAVIIEDISESTALEIGYRVLGRRIKRTKVVDITPTTH